MKNIKATPPLNLGSMFYLPLFKFFFWSTCIFNGFDRELWKDVEVSRSSTLEKLHNICWAHAWDPCTYLNCILTFQYLDATISENTILFIFILVNLKIPSLWLWPHAHHWAPVFSIMNTVTKLIHCRSNACLKTDDREWILGFN